MINGKEIIPPRREFQTVIQYRDWDRIPSVVARQTSTLLALFHQGAINKPGLAKDYLWNYTLAYLREAEEGADILYHKRNLPTENTCLEIREAADHALITFAHLPDILTSPFVPKGFSRRGMLKAPATIDEFLLRIRELKIGLWQVTTGEMEPQATLEACPSLLRTYGFFKVGGELPIKLLEDERKRGQMEKEWFNDLLKGVNISSA